MQSEAYKLTGLSAVAGALGFLLRWLQNMQILEADTGLARAGRPISWVVALYIAAVAGVLLAVTHVLRRCGAPETAPEALRRPSPLHTALWALPGVVIGVAGFWALFADWSARQATVWRLCGVAAILCAAGLLLLVKFLRDPEKALLCRVCVVLVILFGAMWLVAEYKSASADPVIWRFAVEILAQCAALLAFYYVAGYFFDDPNPRWAIFFCHAGGFLCIMSAVDEHSAPESLLYAAVAVLLLTWGYALTANLSPAPAEADAPAEIAEEAAPAAPDDPEA